MSQAEEGVDQSSFISEAINAAFDSLLGSRFKEAIEDGTDAKKALSDVNSSSPQSNQKHVKLVDKAWDKVPESFRRHVDKTLDRLLTKQFCREALERAREQAKQYDRTMTWDFERAAEYWATAKAAKDAEELSDIVRLSVACQFRKQLEKQLAERSRLGDEAWIAAAEKRLKQRAETHSKLDSLKSKLSGIHDAISAISSSRTEAHFMQARSWIEHRLGIMLENDQFAYHFADFEVEGEEINR